jgi:heat shock protein HtpX
MANFYQQINNNKWRSFLVVTLFVLFVGGAGYLLSYTFNSQYFLPIAIGYSLISAFSGYFLGDKIVLSLNKAIPANRKDHFEFYTVTENLAKATGIPKPKIYVIKDDAMNAFATGRNPQNATICATTGLLDKLNRTELEGVVAHELSHVRNYDTLLMTMVSVLLGTLSALISFTNRSLWFRGNDRNSDQDNRDSSGIFQLLGFFLLLFAPLIAQLIQLAISRRREFLADASAVGITRQPSGLISALKKISQDHVPFTQASKATDSLYINNPFKGQGIANLFSTHPPIKERIIALQNIM